MNHAAPYKRLFSSVPYTWKQSFPAFGNSRYHYRKRPLPYKGNNCFLYWEQASLSKISQMIFL